MQIYPQVSITPLLQCVKTFKLALLRSCAQAGGVFYAESLFYAGPDCVLQEGWALQDDSLNWAYKC